MNAWPGNMAAKRRRTWSGGDLARLKKLRADGVALARIAQILARPVVDVRAQLPGRTAPVSREAAAAVAVPVSQKYISAAVSQKYISAEDRKNQNAVIEQMWHSGLSMAAMAARLGLSATTIRARVHRMRCAGVDLPARQSGFESWPPRQQKRLVQLWADPSLSAADIAVQMGLFNAAAVYSAVQSARRHGKGSRFPSRQHLRQRRGKNGGGSPHSRAGQQKRLPPEAGA